MCRLLLTVTYGIGHGTVSAHAASPITAAAAALSLFVFLVGPCPYSLVCVPKKS